MPCENCKYFDQPYFEAPLFYCEHPENKITKFNEITGQSYTTAPTIKTAASKPTPGKECPLYTKKQSLIKAIQKLWKT